MIRVRKTSGSSSDTPEDNFEFREGDRLTVHYAGAKLQIAPYSSIETDGAIYSRTLKEGDDPVTEFDKIYEYLKKNSLKNARSKLQAYAEELNDARKTARGEG